MYKNLLYQFKWFRLLIKCTFDYLELNSRYFMGILKSQVKNLFQMKKVVQYFQKCMKLLNKKQYRKVII